ncbi:Trk K+ transport system, NAD-binding component [Streptomyces sp. SceaMP-e96]|uniref:NAD-binding protein n=1 Tax=Streptomyces TaxID=1883 RepID=UPI000823DC63|nr:MULTISPECIES: NAD(P)-binding protein [unclassified Streptomyces]MYT16698.1 potassium transporter TrkA [Streptomyces sp. SID4951]SCK34594.1 Trk K+ transport system, NAD-binding component [Streptomyces sp. SceaMP-e96]
MVVCGDDALASRLAIELREIYGQSVVVVVPPAQSTERIPAPLTARGDGRAAALRERMAAVMTWAAGSQAQPGASDTQYQGGIAALEASVANDAVLTQAGIERAAALALVYDDDETNIRAALIARRRNPHLRLVIRLYNRKLGQHLEELLDQSAILAAPGLDPAELDASTTVLSDADTAAPALAATAIAGSRKVVHADGLLLRAAERTPPARGEVTDPGLCTLALLSATTNDPAGTEGSDSSGDEAPLLLPDDHSVVAATGRGTMVLETVSYEGPGARVGPLTGRSAPFASLFSRRLRWSLAGAAAAVLALAITSWITTDQDPRHAAYVTVLDLFAINDPALGKPISQQILQLLAGVLGLLLLPVMVAAALEALGTFRTASQLRHPPRGQSGHVVLLGLGKIGTRVLARLRELDIPVVCVEEDPEARGITLARRLRVPTVLGDVSEEGVLEAAKIHRAHALLALTSSDTTNLEAALYARSVKSDLRVALRLYDDDFATAVYRTLRTAHPDAVTRSRSVSTLAAPAFAGAMMGRQILGAIPIERRVLLIAALTVAGHPQLEGRTVAEAFQPGAWRVLALDPATPDERQPDLASPRPNAPKGPRSGLVWDLHPGYVLQPHDRIVLATTRHGLAELLGHPAPQGSHPRLS